MIVYFSDRVVATKHAMIKWKEIVTVTMEIKIFCMMEIKNFTKDFEKHGAIDWRQGLKFEKLYLTVYKNWRKFWQGHTLSINPINKF